MKPRANAFAAIVAIAILAGCASLHPGQDPVVVRAEQTTQISFEVLNQFVTWERANEVLVGPDVNRFANEIRLHAPVWFTRVRELTKVYKANRSPENKASLLTAIAVIETAMAQAQRVLANSQNSNIKLSPYSSLELEPRA
jgi:hypothetical protein